MVSGKRYENEMVIMVVVVAVAQFLYFQCLCFCGPLSIEIVIQISKPKRSWPSRPDMPVVRSARSLK
jgi:hypothetical protein